MRIKPNRTKAQYLDSYPNCVYDFQQVTQMAKEAARDMGEIASLGYAIQSMWILQRVASRLPSETPVRQATILASAIEWRLGLVD